MLIAVVGTSGLGRVAGVPGGSPAALLRVVADQPDQEVVVLTPEHTESSARRQADLVAAARPSARVSVLASRHHALTLTVAADRILESAPWMTGMDAFLDLVRAELSTARSLVWSPSAWRLRGVDLSLGARLRCLVGGRGPILELGQRAITTPDCWRPRAGELLYTAGPIPARLEVQLDGGRHHSVDTQIEDSPYAPRSAQLLTALPATPARAAEAPVSRPPTPNDSSTDRPRHDTVTQESEAA